MFFVVWLDLSGRSNPSYDLFTFPGPVAHGVLQVVEIFDKLIDQGVVAGGLVVKFMIGAT